LNKFVSQKELPGVASCTISPDNYSEYYVEEYNPGKLGIQPHNFVIKGGEPMELELYDNLKSENNFEWLNQWLSHENKNIEPERSYNKSNASFVFKTNGADVSMIFRHEFRKLKKMEISSAFFAPFGNQKLTITVNFQTDIVLNNEDFDITSGVDNDWTTCSIVLNGNAILFGGKAELRQISVVYRNGIKRINTLPFDFYKGRCHFNIGAVFLCFDYDETKLCRTRYIH